MSTNLWKIGSKYTNYVMFAVWLLAFISQLMSLLEIRRDVNILIWIYVVFYFGSFVDFVIAIFYFLSYEKAYSSEQSNTNYTAAVAMKESVREEFQEFSFTNFVNFTIIKFYYE